MTTKERITPQPTQSPTASGQEKKASAMSAAAAHVPSTKAQTGPKTRITIRYDAGYPNALYLRGNGANLSWEKGIELKNIGRDTWVWETTIPFTTCEFKVLINDTQYEIGENHLLSCGATIQYTPQFSY